MHETRLSVGILCKPITAKILCYLLKNVGSYGHLQCLYSCHGCENLRADLGMRLG